MGFAIKAMQAVPGTSLITSDRRLYLADDDQTVVEEGDARARFLLCAAGNEIPADTVKRLGLSVKEGRVVYPGAKVEAKKSRKGEDELAPDSTSGAETPAPEPEPEPTEPPKQVDKPEDKQRAPGKNKAGKRGR